MALLDGVGRSCQSWLKWDDLPQARKGKKMRRCLGGLVGWISGSLLILKLKDTRLRGQGRGLGGLVGSIWGVPLLLLKLRDTNLRGHENLSRITGLIKLIVVMSSAVVFICFLDDHNCCPGI